MTVPSLRCFGRGGFVDRGPWWRQRRVQHLLLAGLFALATGTFTALASAQETSAVVATITPVHSLVAGVMEGTGRPLLLVRGAASPHRYSLRPSEARALSRARVVFWVGEQLETFLGGALPSLAPNARLVELMAAEGVRLHPYRTDGPDHGREEASAGGAYPHEPGGGWDPHIWLDPTNAKAIAAAAAAALSAVDPGRTPLYEGNARTMMARLDALATELEETLRSVRERGFVVFHDSLQYFERRFGLNHVASLVVQPDRPASARRLAEVQARIRETGTVCVFAEPQFDPSLARTVAEGTGTRVGIVDPLGAKLEPGPDAYFRLMRGIAAAVAGCLAGEG